MCALMMDEAPKEVATASEKEISRLALPLQHLIDLEHVQGLSKGSAEVWLEKVVGTARKGQRS